jgi:hypothetical protein
MSIVGASVEGLLWLTSLGMLTFLGAVAYATLSCPARERQDDDRNTVFTRRTLTRYNGSRQARGSARYGSWCSPTSR